MKQTIHMRKEILVFVILCEKILLIVLYECVCDYFMIMMNTFTDVDRIQQIADIVSGRNNDRGKKTRIVDLPPELLEKVFGLMDFQCKRNCRVVHDYWRAIIDHNFMKFKIETWDETRSVHAIETLAASQQYFEKVTISFLWGRPCLTLPVNTQPDHPFPKIRDLVVGSYCPVKHYVEAKFHQGNPTNLQSPSLPRLQEILKFVFQRVCGRAEYLSIDLKSLTGLMVPEMISTLSDVTWSSMRKVKFCMSPQENLCLLGVMKFAKIPVLSEFEIDIFPAKEWRNLEQEPYILTSFFVDMCHFLLKHKETLRTVNCIIDTMSGPVNFGEEIAFIHDQLKLEHCQVRMVAQLIRLDLGFVAIAFTKGLNSLRSFELVKEYDYWADPENYNCKLQKDLKEVLRRNGPTLENLSLGFMKIHLDLLKHCTQLKSLKFGYSVLIEGKCTLHLETVQEFTYGYARINEKFANWIVKQMPNLKVFTLKKCRIEKPELRILMKLNFLREIKVRATLVDTDFERQCFGNIGRAYKKHVSVVRCPEAQPFYTDSIFIDRLT